MKKLVVALAAGVMLAGPSIAQEVQLTVAQRTTYDEPMGRAINRAIDAWIAGNPMLKTVGHPLDAQLYYRVKTQAVGKNMLAYTAMLTIGKTDALLEHKDILICREEDIALCARSLVESLESWRKRYATKP